MSRHFHIDQARKLLPLVARDMQQAIALKEEHELATAQLQAMHQHVAMMGGVILDRERLMSHRTRREASAGRLKEVLDNIHDLGVQIKDLDIGLLDFPTFYQDREVLLCWRLGEDDIEYWHGVDEGFRGRKLIDQDFLENHRGDLVD
ncbi:MAG: DUF2203 domain-containing protein [Bryobacteraceae bacterium]